MSMKKPTLLLGIDIGGTKISVCVGDKSGKIHAQQRVAASKIAHCYQTGLAQILDLTQTVTRIAGITIADIASVGVAAPAPMDTKRGLLLSSTNLKGWGTAPIVQDLTERLQKPVNMLNDANACALAEMYFGVGQNVQNMVYLTNSTGMGAGIIINGALVEGADDTAGEVGHFVLDPGGPPCACGQHGCFEAYCGGLSVARQLQARIRTEKPDTAILRHADNDIDKIAFPALLAALREDDALAREVWGNYALRMAQGISIIIMTLNPELIVLGTIAIHAGDLLLQPLQQHLTRFAWSAPLKTCRIITSRLGAAVGDYSALAAAMYTK